MQEALYHRVSLQDPNDHGAPAKGPVVRTPNVDLPVKGKSCVHVETHEVTDLSLISLSHFCHFSSRAEHLT